MLGFIRNMKCSRCFYSFPISLMKTISKGVHVCKDAESCLIRQRERKD